MVSQLSVLHSLLPSNVIEVEADCQVSQPTSGRITVLLLDSSGPECQVVGGGVVAVGDMDK